MVRVKSSGRYIARPAWYDRNPIPRVFYWHGTNVAPHAATERFSYTVPAGKKAMVETQLAEVFRRTAATTVGDAYAYFQYAPAGGQFTRPLYARVVTNDIKDKDSEILGASFMMFPGDAIGATTADASTGGACDYKLEMKITEFAA